MTRTKQDTIWYTQLSSGTVGTTPAVAVKAQLDTWFAENLSDGLASFEQIQTGLNSGTVDNYTTAIYSATDADVYKCIGDRSLVNGAGDAIGYFVIDITNSGTRMTMVPGHDWSSTDQQLATGWTTTINRTFTNSAAIDMWLTQNEYGFCLATYQSTAWHWFPFEISLRTHIPPSQAGTAVATQAITGGGGNQAITVDRDLTAVLNQITVGQSVWVVPQTAFGDAFETPTIEELTVVAVTATTITLNPTNSYAVGARIGLDPSPVGMGENTTAESSKFTVAETRSFTDAASHTWLTKTSNPETWNDPGPLGFHHGYPVEYGGAGTSTGHRGEHLLITGWTSEAQTALTPDQNRDGGDNSQLYLPMAGHVISSGYVANFGPYENLRA